MQKGTDKLRPQKSDIIENSHPPVFVVGPDVATYLQVLGEPFEIEIGLTAENAEKLAITGGISVN